MLDLFNIAKPQGCDIQTFYGAGTTIPTSQKTWTKPRGVSHVYMMLIGSGGNGDGTNGGGSGAVTVWYGAAQNVPDSLLLIIPSKPEQSATSVCYRQTNTGLTPTTTTGILLSAANGNGLNGGAAMAANFFTASGFFQSVAGVAGNTGGGAQTTFLCGGDSAGSTTGNYGYVTALNGIFQLQPIIVGVGAVQGGKGGIGCGGGFNSGVGGPGMVLIASW